MARGHHYRADGGKIQSYTNTPNNVEDEAEGKRRADGGAAPAARADGGAAKARKDGGAATSVTARANGGRLADGGDAMSAAMPGKKRARGGMLKSVDMEGVKTKNRRLDRPGRKRGGGVGSDMTPLTTAATTTQAGDHKADGDELAH